MSIYIRPIEKKDVKGLADLRTMKGVIETTNGMPSESYTLWEKKLETQTADYHPFVAIDILADGEEKVVGWASLFVGDRRHRHVGSIGIFVRTDYQGQGIGSQLMEAVLDIADNWLMLRRVELDVYAGNEVATKMYENFGFKVEGVKVDASISEGKYCDLILMGRIKKYQDNK